MRVFIGLAIPEYVRKRFQELFEKAEGRPSDFRPTAPDNWHCTLAFLGEVAEEHIDALKHLIAAAAERPPGGSFSFTNFETFPPKHPSYLIVRAEPQPKDQWMSFIDRMRDMVSVVSPTIDRKPWIPHVSVGRARKGKLLAPWISEFKPFEWQPESLCLVKSQLASAGSVYTDLCCFPMTPPFAKGGDVAIYTDERP
jgi:2'-5' RNA ligase